MIPNDLDIAAEAIAKQLAEAMVMIEERHRRDLKHMRRIELEQVLVMIEDVKKIQASVVLIDVLEQKIRERMKKIYLSEEAL